MEIKDDYSFELMAKYLLFFATYTIVPVPSVIDQKIKENIENGGNAKNIVFWNWTPEQKSLLDANIFRDHSYITYAFFAYFHY